MPRSSWYQKNKERALQYQREYEARNRERIRARRRAFEAVNRDLVRAAQRIRDRRRTRGDRRAYARQWWEHLKATNPALHAQKVKRANSVRAVAGLPPELHEMRLTLMEFRSALIKHGASA